MKSSLRTVIRTALASLLIAAPVAGSVLPSASAQAAAPQVRTQAPGYYRMMLGDVEVTALSDGTVTIPLDQLLTDTTREQVEQLLARGYLKSQVETSINAFLINTGTQLALVDTGAGELFGPKSGGRLLANLRAAGYRPDQVDAVLFTHVHTDHSGGLTLGGIASFPKAIVYVDKHEADFWLNPVNERTAADGQKHGFGEAAVAFAPYLAAGKVRTFEINSELLPGIRAIRTPGHTPGHSFYEVESRGQRLRLWAT
jgi:glyoxylase-like metal-dependent hydrolase (beta-lactamase superfamily II)